MPQLTSRHWPNGARFLQQVDAFTRKVATFAKPTTIGDFCAIAYAKWAIRNGALTPIHGVDLLYGFEHITHHERLALRRDETALITAGATFLHEAAALPGLQAYALLPYLSYATAGPRSPYADSGRGGLFLDDPQAPKTRHDPSATVRKRSTIDAVTTFGTAAQAFLAAVDTLCDRVPEHNAPIWHVFEPDKHLRFTPACPPFRANRQQDALAIAPILAWDWSQARRLIATHPPPADIPHTLIAPRTSA